jgi:MFS family permease
MGALGERQFGLFFAGQSFSLLGDGMVAVALAFAVLDLTGAASDLGYVLAARMLPLMAVVLVGGVAADRVSRRTVMIAADLVRFGSQGVLAALLVGGHASIWQIAVLQAAHGAASGFFYPASTAFVPMTVTAERLQQANSLLGLARSAGNIAGPALAGVIVVSASPGWAIAADAATFGLSAVFLAALRVPRQAPLPSRSFVADLREGWDEFRSRTWLWVIVLAASLVNLLYASVTVLGPKVAEDDLGGAGSWALIVTLSGVGSIAGGLVALRLRSERPLLIGSAALALFCLTPFALALVLPVWAVALTGFLGGAGVSLFVALWETTMQRHVPAASLSRVSAYDAFGSLTLYPLGLAIAGPIAVVVGTSETLWLTGSCILAVTVSVLAVREVRSLPPRPVPIPTMEAP